MIVVITAAAEHDLETIADRIAQYNPDRALTFLAELRRRCETLIDAPEGYALVPRYEALGIRRRPYHDYLIFYQVAGEAIEILRALHGARDYEAILFPGEQH
jgi:plasmid stabilization system protein ParE